MAELNEETMDVFEYLEKAVEGCRAMADQDAGAPSNLGQCIASIHELAIANTVAIQSLAKSLKEAGIDTTLFPQRSKELAGLFRNEDGSPIE